MNLPQYDVGQVVPAQLERTVQLLLGLASVMEGSESLPGKDAAGARVSAGPPPA